VNVDLALFVLRVTVGVVVAAHGILKFGWLGGGASLAGVAGWFHGLGFRPGMFWALVAALAESVGGLLMILGLGGPIGPGIVAADLVVVTIVAHWPKGFWAQNGGVEFPVPLAAGAFAIALIGPGAWSLDALLRLTYPEWLLPAWAALMAVGVALALAIRALFAPRAQTANQTKSNQTTSAKQTTS
jgi:putative oxidoreductase